jgi:hypothetical protein
MVYFIGPNKSAPMEYSEATKIVEAKYPHLYEDMLNKLYKNTIIKIAEECQADRKPSLDDAAITKLATMEEYRQIQWCVNPYFQSRWELALWYCFAGAPVVAQVASNNPSKPDNKKPDVKPDIKVPDKEPEEEDEGGGIFDLFG